MSAELALDLSVLIATRSRAASLRQTLESMCRMDCAGLAWELVVVDNGSEDATPALLQEYAQRLPLRGLRVPEPGQNRARNRVLPSLRGRYTILSDDDVLVAPDWLRQWHEGIARWPQETVFGGTILPRFPPDTAGWISGRSFPFRAQCFAEFRPRAGEGPYDGTPFGPNFAVSTALLQQQRFREDLGPAAGSYAMGGETELVGRLLALGHRVIYLPQSCVEHVLLPENLSPERLLQRGFNAGRGDEYRRAMRERWGRARLWWRAEFFLPLKLAFYALLCALARPASPGYRFRRQYKHQSAQGRRYQLRLMRQQGPQHAR